MVPCFIQVLIEFGYKTIVLNSGICQIAVVLQNSYSRLFHNFTGQFYKNTILRSPAQTAIADYLNFLNNRVFYVRRLKERLQNE